MPHGRVRGRGEHSEGRVVLKRDQRSQQLCYTNFYQKIKQRQTSEKQYDFAFGTHTHYLPPSLPRRPLAKFARDNFKYLFLAWAGGLAVSVFSSGSASAWFLFMSVLCCASLTYQWHFPSPTARKNIATIFYLIAHQKKKKKTKTKNKQSTLCHKNTIFIFACKL